MTDSKRLVVSIVQFLKSEMDSGTLGADANESLEVAIQCLESVYNISASDTRPPFAVARPLLSIFNDGTREERKCFKPPQQSAPRGPPNEEAEQFKVEGNTHMKEERFEEALQCYSKAIEIDPSNAVYYCNRAAAHSKLDNHLAAIEDCEKALEIDPAYSKAYGRLGLAYASRNQHQRAKECYERAVQLDPDNQSYLNNLRVAEEKLRAENAGDSENRGAAGGGMPQTPFGSGFDIGSILNNPALAQWAAQLMQDPNMQSMMSSILSGPMAQLFGGMVPPGGAPGAGGTTTTTNGSAAPPPPPPPQQPPPQAPPQQQAPPGDGNANPAGPGGFNFESLLRAGQQFAQQMQQQNPDLVEALRREMESRNIGGEGNNAPSGGNGGGST